MRRMRDGGAGRFIKEVLEAQNARKWCREIENERG